jgi:hypothetical protein
MVLKIVGNAELEPELLITPVIALYELIAYHGEDLEEEATCSSLRSYVPQHIKNSPIDSGAWTFAFFGVLRQPGHLSRLVQRLSDVHFSFCGSRLRLEGFEFELPEIFTVS